MAALTITPAIAILLGPVRERCERVPLMAAIKKTCFGQSVEEVLARIEKVIRLARP
jgi:hypothetical protein